MRIFATIIISILLLPQCGFAQDDCESCSEGLGAGSQYAPDDPWTRGRWWLRQTGHFGKFYNCDCEEKKRCSPYICWKKSDSPFTGGRFFQSLKCDWLSMKQRIIDGSECCGGKRCRKQPGKSCHCGSCE